MFTTTGKHSGQHWLFLESRCLSSLTHSPGSSTCITHPPQICVCQFCICLVLGTSTLPLACGFSGIVSAIFPLFICGHFTTKSWHLQSLIQPLWKVSGKYPNYSAYLNFLLVPEMLPRKHPQRVSKQIKDRKDDHKDSFVSLLVYMKHTHASSSSSNWTCFTVSKQMLTTLASLIV